MGYKYVVGQCKFYCWVVNDLSLKQNYNKNWKLISFLLQNFAPVKLLSLRYNTWRLSKLAKFMGMLPERLLPPRSMNSNEEMLKIEDGIFPTIRWGKEVKFKLIKNLPWINYT